MLNLQNGGVQLGEISTIVKITNKYTHTHTRWCWRHTQNVYGFLMKAELHFAKIRLSISQHFNSHKVFFYSMLHAHITRGGINSMLCWNSTNFDYRIFVVVARAKCIDAALRRQNHSHSYSFKRSSKHSILLFYSNGKKMLLL